MMKGSYYSERIVVYTLHLFTWKLFVNVYPFDFGVWGTLISISSNSWFGA
jgi:hypothetical protein